MDVQLKPEESLKIFQKGFHYSQDGQGNRLILHLQGCNMHCPWCSNPEGMDPGGTLMTDAEWLRESCCPKGAVKNGVLERTACESCTGRPCLRMRQKGITSSCKTYPLEEIVSECIAGAPMYFDGGGVTLTGGEISMQFEAVKKLLIRLGEEGIHRAVETNGSHPRMEELFPHVDQWIMDVKHYDDGMHQRYTGVSNRNTIRTLALAATQHPDVLVRIPLIPGFNDRPGDAAGFAALFSGIIPGTDAKVELLTYHEFGKGKWEQCGMVYQMPHASVDPAVVKEYRKTFADARIPVVRT